jgi:hypothetical protein
METAEYCVFRPEGPVDSQDWQSGGIRDRGKRQMSPTIALDPGEGCIDDPVCVTTDPGVGASVSSASCSAFRHGTFLRSPGSARERSRARRGGGDGACD